MFSGVSGSGSMAFASSSDTPKYQLVSSSGLMYLLSAIAFLREYSTPVSSKMESP